MCTQSGKLELNFSMFLCGKLLRTNAGAPSMRSEIQGSSMDRMRGVCEVGVAAFPFRLTIFDSLQSFPRLFQFDVLIQLTFISVRAWHCADAELEPYRDSRSGRNAALAVASARSALRGGARARGPCHSWPARPCCWFE